MQKKQNKIRLSIYSSDKGKSKKHQKQESIKEEKIMSDVLGSYTGVPENPNDTPIQDADDL